MSVPVFTEEHAEMPKPSELVEGEGAPPAALPPGIVGWALGRVQPDMRSSLVAIFFLGLVAFGVLWSRAVVEDKFEGVASAAVKPIARKQKRDHQQLLRIEEKLDVLGDAVLTKVQRDDPRWRSSAGKDEDADEP